MSNYVQTTFFTPKDSLPTSNPAKTIFGSAYDIEFGNISTAISTKIDSTSAVTGIAGTANQITASSSIGNVVLSFPANLVLPAPVSGITLTITGIGSTSALKILTTGVQVGNPTGGDQGSGTINVSSNFFVNGVAVVTGAAAAGSLTGTTLASNVVTSSLTSVGTLTSLAVTGAVTAGSGVFGSPTGGNEGAGTVNATGYFLNGVSVLSSISGNSLTGTSLAAGIVNSSLTSVGTLATGSIPTSLLTGSFASTVTASGAGISASPTSGAVVISNTGVTSIVAGTNVTISGATGAVTVNSTAAGGATTGSFTATTTGLSGATMPCSWTLSGNSVTLFVGTATGTTGTGTSFSITNLPAAIQPVTSKYAAGGTLAVNNSAQSNSLTALVIGATLSFGLLGNSIGWTVGVRQIGLASGSSNTFVWDIT